MFSCKPQTSLKQNFEKHLTASIETCAQSFIEKGVDSVKAKQMCRCALTTLYEIDSTLFELEKARVQDFFDKHKAEVLKQYPEFNTYFNGEMKSKIDKKNTEGQ